MYNYVIISNLFNHSYSIVLLNYYTHYVESIYFSFLFLVSRGPWQVGPLCCAHTVDACQRFHCRSN